jgi:hypothetical protein
MPLALMFSVVASDQRSLPWRRNSSGSSSAKRLGRKLLGELGEPAIEAAAQLHGCFHKDAPESPKWLVTEGPATPVEGHGL